MYIDIVYIYIRISLSLSLYIYIYIYICMYIYITYIISWYIIIYYIMLCYVILYQRAAVRGKATPVRSLPRRGWPGGGLADDAGSPPVGEIREFKGCGV